MARKKVERNISYDDVRGLYYVCMDMGVDSAGKRIRQYRTYTTLTSARAGLKQFIILQSQQKLQPRCEQTLEQWLEYWLEHIVRPSRAETTTYAYERIVENHVAPRLGLLPLSKLTPQKVQEYYVSLARDEGLSANTIRRHHDLLSASLRSAVRHEKLRSSPMDRVEPPRSQLKEASFYDRDNLRRLYLVVEGHWLELAVKIAGGMGLRREEICGLKWDCVNFERRVLHIRAARTTYGSNIIQKETKNRSSVRSLFLPDELYELLLREQNRQQAQSQVRGGDYAASGHVILDREGRPYSPNALSLAFSRFIKKNGLPPLTLHGLRHSFATVASAQGAPLFDIGKALGHSTPATTGRIYTHLVDRTHEETLLRVSAALHG
ncbi:MAG: site-specific integrase [Lawsonibacter sp.]|nr:site-specific integrase [Lawsonibacter sp.]